MYHRLRPLGLREIFDLPFFMLRERFWSFQGIIFWTFLPAAGVVLLMLLIAFLTIWWLAPAGVPWNQALFWSLLSSSFKENSAVTVSIFIILFLLLLVFIVVWLIGYYYFTYASIRLFGCVLHDQPCNYRQAFQGRQGKIVRIFLFFLLQFIIYIVTSYGFGLILSLLLFPILLLSHNPTLSAVFAIVIQLLSFLFNLIILTIFLLTPAIIVLENSGLATAMARAFRILKNFRWRTIGILALTYLLIYLLLMGSFSLLVILVSLFIKWETLWFLLPITIALLGTLVIFSIVFCFHNGVLTSLYFDLVVRKEGYDLQLRLENQNQSGPN